MHKLLVISETHLQSMLELENESFTDPLESDTELEGVNPGPATSETHFSLKRNAALFLLKTKEKGRVSQATLDGLVSDLTNFIRIRLNEVQREVRCIIQHGSVQVPNDVAAAIERSFNREEISFCSIGI